MIAIMNDDNKVEINKLGINIPTIHVDLLIKFPILKKLYDYTNHKDFIDINEIKEFIKEINKDIKYTGRILAIRKAVSWSKYDYIIYFRKIDYRKEKCKNCV